MSSSLDHHLTTAWRNELSAMDARLAPFFRRAELRDRARAYLRGLLSGVERKNGWQLAEAAADATPYGMQHLLGRAHWEADAVRDELRGYVTEQLGTGTAVLIIDETGFLKKGTYSVGVKRQYSGTAGRIENSQVGVFLAYATNRGRAFVDRELYVPAEWATDTERRAKAGIPADLTFATKPELAERMLSRALDAGVTAAWVVADAVYGDSRHLGMLLEGRCQPYVLALSGKAYMWADGVQRRVSDLRDEVQQDAATDWQRLSAGEGAKGPRTYDWCRLPLDAPLQEGFARWVLVRRSVHDPDEVTAYTVFAPAETTLPALAQAAGSRWQVEIGFEEAKGQVGLDEYEVRSWHGWYRHITLALVAHAMLVAMRAAGQAIEESGERPVAKGGPTPCPDSLAAFKRGRSSR